MAICLVCLFAFTACDQTAKPQPSVPETEDSAYKDARNMLRDGNTMGALMKFLEVIDARTDAAESHLEAGRIYLSRKEPLDAIYHFRQFLRIRPNAEQAPQVGDLIRTADRAYLQSIPGRPFEVDATKEAYQDRLTESRRENDDLKKKISDLEMKVAQLERRAPTLTSSATPSPSPATSIEPLALVPAQPPPPTVANANPIPETYTVKAGDTLYRISQKVYGTGTRYKEIYKANRDQLSSEQGTLRIGMVLKIPR
ncbi:MAG: LysM peptidoglycan-binding domain-containing protein [Puniceicoccales bacterium]|nr:LysM peptidoglycan-binding domain-containing protein [Puniceicoccales bacterium]